MRTEHLLTLLLLASLVAIASTAPTVHAQETPVAGPVSEKIEKPPVAKPKTTAKTSSDLSKIPAAVPATLLDVEMTMIDGKKVNLKKYSGKVVLVVNVASKCGFTGQYRPLQALHEKYHAKGLSVVAFPCNQFGNQEPKDEAEINTFCKDRFGIKFDIFSKVKVKGKNQAAFFKALTAQKVGPVGSGDIKWNFEKFLINKEGKPIARFASNVSPDSKLIVTRIESALGIEAAAEEKKEDASENKQSAKTPATDNKKDNSKVTAAEPPK